MDAFGGGVVGAISLNQDLLAAHLVNVSAIGGAFSRMS
jgi:hypothetical protein